MYIIMQVELEKCMMGSDTVDPIVTDIVTTVSPVCEFLTYSNQYCSYLCVYVAL